MLGVDESEVASELFWEKCLSEFLYHKWSELSSGKALGLGLGLADDYCVSRGISRNN